ncbi:hypothetical protein ACVWW1_007336 [Bradyrhizobium sp. JR3.5]
MQRFDCGNLFAGQAVVAALPRGACQRARLERGLATDRVLHQCVVGAVLRVAGLQHGVGHELDLGRPDPAVAHRHEAGAGAGVLQPDPVDYRNAREDAVEIVGIALRHGQRLTAALGRSHEIHLRRRLAVGADRQRPRGVAHLLVGLVREILERLVVEREQLRRLAGLLLVAGVGADGDEAERQRRGLVEWIGRRQAGARDQHAVEAAAAILQ